MCKPYIEFVLGYDMGFKSVYSKPNPIQLLEGNGGKVLGNSHGINALTIDPSNKLRKQVAEQDYTIKTELAQQREQHESLQKKLKLMEQYLKLYNNSKFAVELKKGVKKVTS